MKRYICVLAILIALAVSVVASSGGKHNDNHQQVLHAAATKLTDKIAAAKSSSSSSSSSGKSITSLSLSKVASASLPPTPVAPYEAAFESSGWGAIHLRHRLSSSSHRVNRITQLRDHQTSLAQQHKDDISVTTTALSSKVKGKKVKAHARSRHNRHRTSRSRTLAKIAAHSTSDLTTATTSNSSSVSEDVLLSNLDDIEYEAIVTLGTPPQSFTVIVDTGSTDLWLPSSDCSSDGCDDISTFAWSESSTFIDLEVNITESFGSGTLTGYLATDTFGIGNLTLVKQTVALIESEDIDTTGFGGLMGMAFEALSDTGASPVFDNMMLQGLLTENVFSLYLSRSTSVDSAIVFGTPRSSLYTGDITYVEVSKQVYWQVNMIDIKVNGVSLNVCPDGCQAVIDSGTSLLTASYDGILPLMDAINAATDCSNLSSLPSVVYVLSDQFGTYELSLNSENYMLAESDGNNIECVAGYMAYDIEDTDGIPIWILGDLFFHEYYMIFDRGSTTTSTARIGFATAT